MSTSRRPRVLTLGEPLVAGVPTTPVNLDAAEAFVLLPGGAEVNVAVGLARLGVSCAYIGIVGEDPLGRLMAERLADEGVDARLRTDAGPTGFYFREWLPDGARRPYYYRHGSAGARLSPRDIPGDLEEFALIHLTGITPALGAGPRLAVEAAVRAANAAGVPVSFDANFRSALWSGDDFRAFLLPLLPSLSLLFVGEEEAELLFGTPNPERALEMAQDVGVSTCIVRLGARGAVARGVDGVAAAGEAPATPLDPVGAGDAFDAGFIAGWLLKAALADCVALGVYCGARAVEVLGEHEGAPSREALPDALAHLFDATR